MKLYETAKRRLAEGNVVTLADGEYHGFGLETRHVVIYEVERPRDARGRFRRPYVGVFEINPVGDTEIIVDRDGTFDVRVAGSK